MSKGNKPKYPKGETIWTGYYDVDGNEQFIMTSKPVRDYFYLYQSNGGEWKKLGKSKNPLELEDKFAIDKVLRKTPKRNL